MKYISNIFLKNLVQIDRRHGSVRAKRSDEK